MTIKPFCQNSSSDSPAIRGSRVSGRAFGVPHQFDRADGKWRPPTTAGRSSGICRSDSTIIKDLLSKWRSLGRDGTRPHPVGQQGQARLTSGKIDRPVLIRRKRQRKRRRCGLTASARLNRVRRSLIAIDLPANAAYIVGMTEKHTQYTIRKVPPHLDEELRRRAHQEHKSLNELALWALARGLGLSEQEVRHHDLDDLSGTWVDDPAFDQAIEAMDRVDPELWS